MVGFGLSFIFRHPFEDIGGLKAYELGFLLILSFPFGFLEGLAGNIPRDGEKEVLEWI